VRAQLLAPGSLHTLVPYLSASWHAMALQVLQAALGPVAASGEWRNVVQAAGGLRGLCQQHADRLEFVPDFGCGTVRLTIPAPHPRDETLPAAAAGYHSER
jgi:hypothetical protein